MLLWCQFLWKLEQGIHFSGPQYSQIVKWMDGVSCRMPSLLGFQTWILSCTFYHWSWVHSYVISPMWRHSHHEPTTKNEGAKLQGHLQQTLCILQGIWRQLGCSGTCKTFQATSKDQAHQRMLPSIPWTHVQGTHKDIPYQHKKTRLLTHSPRHWHKMTISIIIAIFATGDLSKPPKWQSVTYLEYFGTYLGYLLTNPMSRHWGTFLPIPLRIPANPT